MMYLESLPDRSLPTCLTIREPFDVAPFVDGRCKTPIEEIQDAVDGAISPEQAVKLRQCLAHIDELEAHKRKIKQEIFLIVKPFSAILDFLRTIPGLDSNPMTSIAILSEIGPDISVFPSSKNLVSWAGCCPRNDQSGGKVKSTRISRAGCYLKPLLVQIANALIKSKKHPEFKERYHRIKTHRGHKKAIIAVCKMLLTAIWNILNKLEPYTAEGFSLHRPVNESKVLTKAQTLEFLRKRGYTITDEATVTA